MRGAPRRPRLRQLLSESTETCLQSVTIQALGDGPLAGSTRLNAGPRWCCAAPVSTARITRASSAPFRKPASRSTSWRARASAPASAAMAAIDGAARLFDADGIWRSAATSSLYGWTWPVRSAGWLALAAALRCSSSLVVAGGYLPLPLFRLAVLVWAFVVGRVVCGGDLCTARARAECGGTDGAVAVAHRGCTGRCAACTRSLHAHHLAADPWRAPAEHSTTAAMGTAVRRSAGGEPRAARVPRADDGRHRPRCAARRRRRAPAGAVPSRVRRAARKAASAGPRCSTSPVSGASTRST